MKTETLVLFQYQNAATSFMVKATHFSELESGEDKITVATVNGNEYDIVRPSTRAEAMQIAERAIAEFLTETMVPVYLGLNA